MAKTNPSSYFPWCTRAWPPTLHLAHTGTAVYEHSEQLKGVNHINPGDKATALILG